MKTINALALLKSLDVKYFTTQDAAAYLNLTRAHASLTCQRLCQANQLIKLKQGLWGFPNSIDLLELPNILSQPFPSYISLQSALYHHGAISQIPDVIYAVSLARTRQYQTSAGNVSLHHIKPDLFHGFEQITGSDTQMATLEKALFDICYFSRTSSGLFTTLPELDLKSKKIDATLINLYIEKIDSLAIKSRTQKLAHRLLNKDHED